LKFARIAIPAIALLPQHDARRDIVIEPVALRRAAIEARGIPNWRRSELGAQSGRKNPPACLVIYVPIFMHSCLAGNNCQFSCLVLCV